MHQGRAERDHTARSTPGKGTCSPPPSPRGSLHGLGLGTLLFAPSSCLALGEVWYRTAYPNNRRLRPDTDGEEKSCHGAADLSQAISHLWLSSFLISKTSVCEYELKSHVVVCAPPSGYGVGL